MQYQHSVCANPDRLLYGQSLVLGSDSTNMTVHNCEHSVVCGITRAHKGKKMYPSPRFLLSIHEFWEKNDYGICEYGKTLFVFSGTGLVQGTDLYKPA